MAGKSFGNAPAAPSSPTSANAFAPTTSEGLVNLSLRDGEIEAMAAAVEHTRRTGQRTDVTSSDGPNGQRIVTRTVDRKPVDKRTQRQREADEWIREAGLSDPHPTHTRRKP